MNSLDARVRAQFEVSWGQARAWIETGKIAVDGQTVTDAQAHAKEGATLTLTMNAPKPNREGSLEDARVVHVDAHIVVVRKPAGISTIPFEEGEQGTLDELVRDWLAKHEKRHQGENGPARNAGRPNLGVVHRIDKETTGLVVFTRTWLAKQSLSSQFRAHTVHRRYIAIAHGNVSALTIRSHLVADRGDGLRGSLEMMRARRGGSSTTRGVRGLREGAEGQLAITHIERIAELDGATLVGCRLETGRTHQIRVHLSEAGHPIVGERVYIRGYASETREPIVAPRLMLHAAELGFIHPATEQPVRWDEPMPGDMEAVMQRLLSSRRRSPS